jgi:hypothetical protein
MIIMIKILRDDLPIIENALFTTDHLTSRCNDSYQSMTFHYITSI